MRGHRGRVAISLLAIVGALCACQDSAQGRQLDVNYATTTGVGSTTGTPMRLSHGRYTFFSSADPPDCVMSVALLDQRGTAIVDDASVRANSNQPAPGAPVGIATQTATAVMMQAVPTMVQQELQAGSYRVKVTTRGNGCAWRVEQILNYILSNDVPPKPIVPPSAPAVDVSLGNTSADLRFRIDVAGIYQFRWAVTPCDRYSADLVRTDGGTVHLGDGQAVQPAGGFVGPQETGGPIFLGVGDWTARVSTRCFWQIGIVPWRGPTGGGGQGFRR